METILKSTSLVLMAAAVVILSNIDAQASSGHKSNQVTVSSSRQAYQTPSNTHKSTTTKSSPAAPARKGKRVLPPLKRITRAQSRAIPMKSNLVRTSKSQKVTSSKIASKFGSKRSVKSVRTAPSFTIHSLKRTR